MRGVANKVVVVWSVQLVAWGQSSWRAEIAWA